MSRIKQNSPKIPRSYSCHCPESWRFQYRKNRQKEIFGKSSFEHNHMLYNNAHILYGPYKPLLMEYQINKSIFIGSSWYYRRPIYVDYPKKNQLAIRKSYFLIRWQDGATIKVSFEFIWICLNESFLSLNDFYFIFTVFQIRNCIFSWTMGELYSQHKDADGFLYIAYSGENTFGN